MPLCFRNEPEEAPFILNVTVPLRADGFVKQIPMLVIPSESGPVAIILSWLAVEFKDVPAIKFVPASYHVLDVLTIIVAAAPEVIPETVTKPELLIVAPAPG